MNSKSLTMWALLGCLLLPGSLSAVTIYENDFESNSSGLSGGYLSGWGWRNEIYRQFTSDGVLRLDLPTGSYSGAFDVTVDLITLGGWDGDAPRVGPDEVIIEEAGGTELFRDAYRFGRRTISLTGVVNTLAPSGLSLLFRTQTTWIDELFGIDNIVITAVEAGPGPGPVLVLDEGSTLAMLGAVFFLLVGGTLRLKSDGLAAALRGC